MCCSCNAQNPAVSSAREEPVIRTASGMVRGVKEGDVDIFRGIPFAAPPLGDLRWRPPQAVTPWEGIRDAKEFGPTCAQAGWGAVPGSIAQGSSEDCLYLNVWRPAGGVSIVALMTIPSANGLFHKAISHSGPILDSKFVTEDLTSGYKSGKHANIPLLIGSNAAEVGGPFVNQSKSKDELFSMSGSLSSEAKAAYDPDGTKEFDEVNTYFNTNKVWAEPARFVAATVAAAGNPAYIFLFSYVPASMKQRMPYGPGHGTDVSYVFNNPRVPERATVPPEDKEIARIMSSYWKNFTRTGDPNRKDLFEC